MTAAPDTECGTESTPTLERELGLVDIVLFGVGGIVGAGIYAIIGEAAAFGGNLLWLSFLVAAFVALLTATTYAELVSRHPDAGGSFEYVKQAFGLRVATFASIFMVFTGVVAAGAIAISFSDYLARLWGAPELLVTLGIVALMGLVNAAGAAEASWFNTFATVVTLLGLGAVVVVSADDIGTVSLIDSADTDLLGLGTGAALIFFSFIGFEDLVKLAEETEDPQRTLPRGLLISAAIVLVVYLLVAVAAVSSLGADDLAASSGPLAEIMETQAGSVWATAIIIVALFATSKTILSNILGTSRLLYDVSRDNDYGALRSLTRISSATRTPLGAVLAVSIAAMAFGAIGDLGAVAAFANISIMTVFIVVNLALIRLRRDHPGDEAPFHVPGAVGTTPVIPIVAIVGIAALLVLNARSLL